MNFDTGSSLFSSARALVRLLLAKKRPKKGSFLWPAREPGSPSFWSVGRKGSGRPGQSRW